MRCPASRPPPDAQQGLGHAPGRTDKRNCTVNASLVPTCGLLWGVAPGAYTDLPPSRALKQFESATGRPADVLHSYHRGDEVFPTADEIATVTAGAQADPLRQLEGGVGHDLGERGQRGRGRAHRPGRRTVEAFPGKMFLALHHEPENDVNPNGGGMTAKTTRRCSGTRCNDCAPTESQRRVRHGVHGVRAVVRATVVQDLWPGDDVVDWVGMDPYLFAKPGGYGHGDFAYLVNRTSDAKKWPGFYTWVTRTHGNKPLMVAEWGVYEYPADPGQKAWIFSRSTTDRPVPEDQGAGVLRLAVGPKGDTRPDSTGRRSRSSRPWPSRRCSV